MDVRISGIVKESVVDGPGIRYVIFAQGCKHNCSGCHNPDTHDFNGGVKADADEIINEIFQRKYLDGVTFSGGDPFFQAKQFKYIAKKLKDNNINIIAYTGFVYDNLISNHEYKELLKYIDILIDGPFKIKEKTYKLPYRGSFNQRAIDVKSSLESGKVIQITF